MNRAFEKKLISIRRDIHRHPELGDQEFRTTSLVESVLKKAKITTRRITPTGIICLIEGELPSGNGDPRVFALRADIDALPVHEKTKKLYSSVRPGIMHACGHDANSTMVLGAALLLAERRKEFSGTVKCIFQPNEESSGGAKTMIDAGALKSPDVEAIVGIHVSPWLPSGVLGLKYGEMMAAVDRFTVEILGEGGHGAYPHLAKDAIGVSAHVIEAFQSIVSRETDPVNPVVITVGKIQGGEKYNIICNKVTMVGTVRTLNRPLRSFIRRQMEKKIRQVTAAFGAGYKFSYESLGSPLVNSSKILDLCRVSGENILGSGKVRVLDKPSMGGEDFAEYVQQVPGCFLYIGTGNGRCVYPWHHERFDIDEAVLPRGAELLAGIAQRYLRGRHRR